jgi:hypothetical protein
MNYREAADISRMMEVERSTPHRMNLFRLERWCRRMIKSLARRQRAGSDALRLQNAGLMPNARVCFFCLLPLFAGCSDVEIYEFWSCDAGTTEVVTLQIPRSYRPTAPSAFLNKDAPRDSVAREGLNRTSFFSTYPGFDPINTATEKEKKNTETALVNTDVISGSIDYGNTIDGILYGASHDLSVKPEKPGFRWREESLDGKYWVYPDPWLRNGKGGSDLTAKFLPKETGRSVVISCQDVGKNVLPDENARCYVSSLMNETPALSCLTISYRLRAADVPQWRDFDARIKAKIRKMISVRKP